MTAHAVRHLAEQLAPAVERRDLNIDASALMFQMPTAGIAKYFHVALADGILGVQEGRAESWASVISRVNAAPEARPFTVSFAGHWLTSAGLGVVIA